jgi:hypothetical protein
VAVAVFTSGAPTLDITETRTIPIRQRNDTVKISISNGLMINCSGKEIIELARNVTEKVTLGCIIITIVFMGGNKGMYVRFRSPCLAAESWIPVIYNSHQVHRSKSFLGLSPQLNADVALILLAASDCGSFCKRTNFQ